jgi:hypothetical protein
MKIYIDNVVFNNELNYDKNYKRNIIYSNEGIYCNHNKKLMLIESTHNKYERIEYNNHIMFLDHSKECFKEHIYCIPYDHLYSEETFEQKHIGYDIILVKHCYFDQISYYFEVERNDDFILDEIISFLSSN